MAGGFTVEKTSTYGTFYLNATSGAYKFVANDSAIEALQTTETATFHVNATDGAADSSSQTITITFNGANDTPLITLAAPSVTFTEVSGPDTGANAVTFGSSSTTELWDDQSDTIQNLKLVVSNADLVDSGSEQLILGASTISLQSSSTTSVTLSADSYSVAITRGASSTEIVLTKSSGNLSQVQAEALLDGLKYNNSSDNPSTSARVFSITTTDQQGLTSAAATKTITPVRSNDAPALADTVLSMTAIDEKAADPAGAVGELLQNFTGGITDTDTGAVKGIAITAVDTSLGVLWYSINAGTNWTLVGAVSNISALLLAENNQTRLYFKPTSPGTVTDAFTFRAWDNTSGSAGAKVDPTTGTPAYLSAFSSGTDTVGVTVTAFNDPPTITTINTLTGGTEDTAYEITYAALADAANEADPDNASISFRVEAISTGTLQRWNGTAWVEATAGSLLQDGVANAANTKFLWTPAANANGAALNAFTVKAFDGEKSSDLTVQVSVAVTPVNDQPVLADTMLSMTAVAEDAAAPANGNTTAGNVITDFVGGISDADTGALRGLAITAVNTTNGSLWYSVNSGTNWTEVTETLSATNALLLASNSSTRLFFQPSANYNGTTSDAFTFKAWDTTSGTATTVSDPFYAIDTTGTAYSTATDTVAITVTSVNDVPINTVPGSTQTLNEDSNILITGLSTSDADGASSTVTVTLSVSNGTVTASAVTDGATLITNGTASVQLSGTVTAVNLTLAAGITFAPSANFNGSDTLTMTTNDGLGGIDSDTVAITVTSVNDRPVLDSTPVLALASVAEDAATPTGTAGTPITDLISGISDVDTGALRGLAITAVNTTNGSLWYSVNGGTNWTAVASVSTTNALLLASNSSTRLFFQPSANYNGTTSDAFTFKAWDQTSGTATTVSDPGYALDTSGTAFSTATDTVAITVTAVNDAPTASFVSSSASGFTLLASDPDTTDSLNLVNWTNGTSASLNNGSNTTVGVEPGDLGTGSSVITVSDGLIQTIVQREGKNLTVVWGTDGVESFTTLTNVARSYLVYGFGDDDMILTGANNDEIYGGDGDDSLNGGAGDDTLNGGAGQDTMVGGSGAETFVFLAGDSGTISGTVFDSITGFTVGAGGDRLDLVGNPPTIRANATSIDVSGATADVDVITGDVASGIITLGGANAGNIDSLNEWISVARTIVPTSGQVAAFQFGSDTYVYQENGTGDLLIKLTGLSGITSLSTSATSHDTIWIS